VVPGRRPAVELLAQALQHLERRRLARLRRRDGRLARRHLPGLVLGEQQPDLVGLEQTGQPRKSSSSTLPVAAPVPYSPPS
jgi:hypothetical protein